MDRYTVWIDAEHQVAVDADCVEIKSVSGEMRLYFSRENRQILTLRQWVAYGLHTSQEQHQQAKTYWVLAEYGDDEYTRIRGVVDNLKDANEWMHSGTDCDYKGPFELGNPDSDGR